MQRCDAKLPCTPCFKDGVSDCVYEQGRVKQPARKLPSPTVQSFSFPLKSKLKPSPRRPPPRVNSEETSPSTPDIASPDIRPSALSLSHRTPSNSSSCRSESRFSESDTPDGSEPPVPREWTIQEMKLAPFQEPPKPRQLAMISISSVLPSPRFYFIPRTLSMSLSFLGPEHFQVSDITSSELDLKLCAFSPLGCHAQKLQQLTSSAQPPRRPTAIEAVWNSSLRPQARCCTMWRPLEHRSSSILRPCLGWARDVFLRRCRMLAHDDPAAR